MSKFTNKLKAFLAYKTLSLIGGKGNYYYYKSLFGTPKEWDEILYIGIVSTGRTGTKFFQKFFDSSSENVLSVHEPFLDTIELSKNFFLKKLEEPYAVKTFLNHRRIFCNQLLSSGKNVFLESEPNLVYLLPIIQKQLPRYKIIHIIRDPRDYVRSFASRQVKLKGKIHRKYDFDKYWKVLPREINDPITTQWEEMDIVGKGAWQWTHVNQEILNHIKDDPNAITIKFEDIFQKEENSKGMETLINFLENNITYLHENPLRLVEQKSNSTKNFLLSDYSGWSLKQKGGFKEIVAPLAGEFQYDL